jgi:hypothetical protein
MEGKHVMHRHTHSRQCYDDPGPGHGKPFTVCNIPEGQIFLSAAEAIRLADKMANLLVRFAENETSQTSYAELRGSNSMDIPVEFLNLCEFAETELGVKLL